MCCVIILQPLTQSKTCGQLYISYQKKLMCMNFLIKIFNFILISFVCLATSFAQNSFKYKSIPTEFNFYSLSSRNQSVTLDKILLNGLSVEETTKRLQEFIDNNSEI